MAKRHEHTFHFSAQQICAAAHDEADYHRRRLEFWKSEQELATKKARESSGEIREYDVTGGKRVEIVFDPTLQSRLSECVNKINLHRAAADRFQIEAAAYGSQGDRSYDLHPDDIVYFRLAGGSRED